MCDERRSVEAVWVTVAAMVVSRVVEVTVASWVRASTSAPSEASATASVPRAASPRPSGAITVALSGVRPMSITASEPTAPKAPVEAPPRPTTRASEESLAVTEKVPVPRAHAPEVVNVGRSTVARVSPPTRRMPAPMPTALDELDSVAWSRKWVSARSAETENADCCTHAPDETQWASWKATWASLTVAVTSRSSRAQVSTPAKPTSPSPVSRPIATLLATVAESAETEAAP